MKRAAGWLLLGISVLASCSPKLNADQVAALEVATRDYPQPVCLKPILRGYLRPSFSLSPPRSVSDLAEVSQRHQPPDLIVRDRSIGIVRISESPECMDAYVPVVKDDRALVIIHPEGLPIDQIGLARGARGWGIVDRGLTDI